MTDDRTTAAIAWALPRMPKPQTDGLLAEFQVLRKPQVVLAMLMSVLLSASLFSVFTYITPMLEGVTRIAPASVTWLLLLFGVGITAGNLLGGRLGDWLLASNRGSRISDALAQGSNCSKRETASCGSVFTLEPGDPENVAAELLGFCEARLVLLAQELRCVRHWLEQEHRRRGGPCDLLQGHDPALRRPGHHCSTGALGAE